MFRDRTPSTLAMTVLVVVEMFNALNALSENASLAQVRAAGHALYASQGRLVRSHKAIEHTVHSQRRCDGRGRPPFMQCHICLVFSGPTGECVHIAASGAPIGCELRRSVVHSAC